MQGNRSEDQEKLRELNRRFLQEIEDGKGWQDVKQLMEDMKTIAKRLDRVEANIVDFDKYPVENKLRETGR